MEPYQPIPGKPPRKVVIDRQRKLFASLDIEELLLEFVSPLLCHPSSCLLAIADLSLKRAHYEVLMALILIN